MEMKYRFAFKYIRSVGDTPIDFGVFAFVCFQMVLKKAALFRKFDFGELSGKLTLQQWIEICEEVIKR
jgi:hypothetical protein